MLSHMDALNLFELRKDYGKTRAVDGVTLSLAPGAFLGFLGRNGAGKSTTLRMVTGLLRPTSGTVRVFGLDPVAQAERAKRLIGAMPEEMALLDMLTGRQYLRFVGRMYGLPDATIDQRTEELFERLELSPDRGALIADYSYGMKKKTSLCAALVHGPKLVVLDEPFEGIDAVTSRTIKDILTALQKSGVTVILTTHVLEVAEKLCPLIAIVDKGQLRGFGPREEVLRQHGTLESLFLDLVGGSKSGELSWL